MYNIQVFMLMKNLLLNINYLYWIYLILIKDILFIFFLSYIVVLAEDAIKAALSDYNIKQKQKLKNNDNYKNKNETWFWYISDDSKKY